MIGSGICPLPLPGWWGGQQREERERGIMRDY